MMIEFLDILWIKKRKNYSFSWHFFQNIKDIENESCDWKIKIP